VFLIAKAVPAIRADGSNFLTEKNWFTGDTPPHFGVAAIAFGTVETAVIALIMAVPVSMGIALFL
jgi:phosphate transport system permease protein